MGDFVDPRASAAIAGPGARPAVAAGASAGDQGVGQLGIVVGQNVLEPGPIFGRRFSQGIRSIARSSVSRTWLAGRAPLNRSRYRHTPIRPNAQARGEVVSVIVGSARSKS